MFLLPARAARVILYCSALGLPPSHYRATQAFNFHVSTTIDHQLRPGEPQINKHDPRRCRQQHPPRERRYLRTETPVYRQQKLRASQESAPTDTDPPSPIEPIETMVSGSSEQHERPEKRSGRKTPKPDKGSAPPSSQGSETVVNALSPPLEILHLDEEFATICKPPLMHVHRPEFGTKDKEFVMQKARNQLGRRIFLPHRLDRGTSGCLLLGFSSEAVKVLHQALADPLSSKTYVAIARGSGQAFIDKGWFTVDRPIKDDKKILREASTRFLFVKGGDDPDPRCCLVLAQPSSGRFHQIRRHLNGLSHPIVGDSVHGNSRFNREVAAHRNPAPAGRLMLHCLRLSLPALPGAGSVAWRSASKGKISSSGSSAEGVYRDNGETSEEIRPLRANGGEVDRTSGSSGGRQEAGLSQERGSGKSDRVDAEESEALGSIPRGGYTPSEQKQAASEAGEPISEGYSAPDSARGVGVVPSNIKDATAGGSSGPAGVYTGSENGVLAEKGFQAYCEPPDDMMRFLRGMSWWEEGMIEAAERSRRQDSSPTPPVL